MLLHLFQQFFDFTPRCVFHLQIDCFSSSLVEQYFPFILLNVLFHCVSIKGKESKMLQCLIDTFSITWYISKTEYFILSLKGDLQSQKKSHIEMEEAKDCWVVIYPCKRTSGGRGGGSTLLSQYSEDKFLCNILPRERQNITRMFSTVFPISFFWGRENWCSFNGFSKVM